MNIKEFINNPSGKGSAMVGSRGILKEVYTNRYHKYVKSNGAIKTQLFYNSKKDIYYILGKIESETVKGVFYDTVIMFHTDNSDIVNSASLKSYDISFFSSCPSFVFTYASASINQDMAIKKLIDKYPKEVKSTKADVRNPNLIMGFEKSTYYLVKHILDNPSILLKDTYVKKGKSLHLLAKGIEAYVKDFSAIMNERTKLEKKEKEKNKKKAIITKKKDKLSSTLKNKGTQKKSVRKIVAKKKIGSKKTKITSKKKI